MSVVMAFTAGTYATVQAASVNQPLNVNPSLDNTGAVYATPSVTVAVAT